MNPNLQHYHVPVNADIHEIETIFVEEDDTIVNPLGVKGMGELGMVGIPAAIANAVFHATGKRMRELPITADKLMGSRERAARDHCALGEAFATRMCARDTRANGGLQLSPAWRAGMLITSSGETAGALSAGCIEDEVALHARDVIASGQPKLVAFDRRRFGCNGSIEIFIQRTDDEFMSQLRDRLAARESYDVVTEFGSNAALVQTIQPPIRLLVIGDGADARALTAQAQLLGWDVHVVAAINELRVAIDDRTAALIATHNFGRDCAALRQLMPLGLRYVGLIGPRRRREELLLDVIDSGAVTKSRLSAPAGLHLSAETPEEIALSIIAEVQAVFAGGTGQHLRDRKTPIHANSSAECATSAR